MLFYAPTDQALHFRLIDYQISPNCTHSLRYAKWKNTKKNSHPQIISTCIQTGCYLLKLSMNFYPDLTDFYYVETQKKIGYC